MRPPRQPDPSLRALAACLALAALALAGCASTREVREEERSARRDQAAAEASGFACLADAVPATACAVGVLPGVALAGHGEPPEVVGKVAVVRRGPVCARAAGGYAVDAAPVVAERLLERWRSDQGFVPLQPVAGRCPAAGDLAALRALRALPGGPVATLEVATLTPPVAADGPEDGARYLLPERVEARLVDLAGGRTLWRDTCAANPAQLAAAATLPGSLNLERVLSGNADLCAQAFGRALGAPTS